jgi:hypothetical protein
MNLLSVRLLVIFILVVTMGISVCDAQGSTDRAPKPEKKGLFGLFSGKKNSSKVNAPKSVSATKKEQAKKKKKQDDAYKKSIKESQERTKDIQTPVVRERMNQNQKEIKEREKAKKKKTSAQTKKAGRKYKK